MEYNEKMNTPKSHEELIREKNEKSYANINYGMSNELFDLEKENQRLKLQIRQIKAILDWNESK